MPSIVPVLDTGTNPTSSSFIESPLLKGKQLLANYLVTDKYQSYSFPDHIYSAVTILLETPDNSAAMTIAVRNELTQLFSRHFDGVAVAVEYRDTTSRILDLDITWEKDGKRYNLTQDSVSIDSILSHVINEHNTGFPLTPQETYYE